MVLDARELIRQFTRVQPVPFVPEFRLHLASELVPLWQATEWESASPQPPPFWAFAWPGSLALARYLADHPETVNGKRVLDFGAGTGLAAIAAAVYGATSAKACDIDPIATEVQRMNAELNNVSINCTTADLVDTDPEVDVVLAGDVCYEREAAGRITNWLRNLTSANTTVLLADPGRHYVPRDGLELITKYEVPVLHELESTTTKQTWIWRLRAI